MNNLKGLFVLVFLCFSSALYSQSPDCDDGADTTPPSVLCIGQTIVIVSNLETDIWAIDMNIGSSDNCTDEDDLIYSFDSIEIVPSIFVDCDHVRNSPSEILIYVIDESGNYAACSVSLNAIPGPTFGCEPVYDPIGGLVTTYDGQAIEGAEVIINSVLPEFPRSVFTDENGNYEFSNVPENVDYTLAVRKDRDPLDGVSTLDLVIIARHILGLQSLESPYLHFAADINRGGSIKVSDLTILRKLILGIIPGFPAGSDWLFFDASHEFDNPNDPHADPPAILLEFLHLGGDISYDFIGVEPGNVR